MIGTIEIKQQQLTNGYFKIGSGNELILIIGSCRSVPYLNYLNDWNKSNRFTICFIDPFNWNWNINDERVDYESELSKQEANENLLSMLRSCSIFIHEYYANAGMFNCKKDTEKNIYQFGLKPEIDVCIPNFNDIFILTRDIVSFDSEIKKKAIQDYNVIGKLSEQTLNEIEIVRKNNLNKFYDICEKSDCSRLKKIFKYSYKKKRYFWTFNHVSKKFTQTVFYIINAKFLKFDLTNYKISEEDLYANNYTYLSEYDTGYQWNEEIKPLREVL